MPIRKSMRWFYPIDWPELSRALRFGRAGGCCEQCGRPHMRSVTCTADGRWRDPTTGVWRDGAGHACPAPAPGTVMRVTRVVLATAHLDHNPGHNRLRNLRCLCQRCHMAHDRPHHLAQRRITYLRRWAVGDLFLGPYRKF